jgi:hypothetical protein
VRGESVKLIAEETETTDEITFHTLLSLASLLIFVVFRRRHNYRQ